MILPVSITIMNVGKLPNVPRICSSHVVPFSEVLLRKTNIVQIKFEFLSLGEHQNIIVTWREPLGLSHSLCIVPHNPAVEEHPKVTIQNIIQVTYEHEARI